MKRRSLKRSLILQKIFDESFRLMNSESHGVVKGLQIFPEGRFPPSDDFQTITIAELTDPPEEVTLQEVPYLGDLLFPALGTDYLPDDFHAACYLDFAKE